LAFRSCEGRIPSWTEAVTQDVSGARLGYKVAQVRCEANGEFRHKRAKGGKIAAWRKAGFIEVKSAVQLNL